MSPTLFLLLNLALGFYDVGTIWAHEIDIFRSWQYVNKQDFHIIQEIHWRKLPYWVFTPVALAIIGAIGLIFYHPDHSPAWGMWGNLVCLLTSTLLTALFWGRWQAKLSQDPEGSQSLYLAKILRTHWLRTLLINASGVILLAWSVQVMA